MGYSFFWAVITVHEVVGRRTGRSSRVEFPIRQDYQNRREIPAAVGVLIRGKVGSESDARIEGDHQVDVVRLGLAGDEAAVDNQLGYQPDSAGFRHIGVELFE
jgi:hypothetical protein